MGEGDRLRSSVCASAPEEASIGLTGAAAMHAPTVRDALQILSGALKISNRGVATIFGVRGETASFLYVVTAPNIKCPDQIVDAAIAMIFNTMRQLSGPDDARSACA